jgi:putative transposase
VIHNDAGMRRLARIDAPGWIHNHVIIRGIEKGAIFRDQGDREAFMWRLETLIPEPQTRFNACVLMSIPPSND